MEKSPMEQYEEQIKKNLPLINEFLKVARRDLKAAQLLYENKLYPHAVFYLEQSAEKIIKALFLLGGIDVPRGHNAKELLKRFFKMNIITKDLLKIDIINKTIDEGLGIKRIPSKKELDNIEDWVKSFKLLLPNNEYTDFIINVFIYVTKTLTIFAPLSNHVSTTRYPTKTNSPLKYTKRTKIVKSFPILHKELKSINRKIEKQLKRLNTM